MGLRTVFLLVVVLLIGGLAALNWGILVEPTQMSIGLMQVTAPFGLIMLGLTALLGVVFLIYVFYLQSSILLETRRHTKEMQAQRELADKAEASRFTELRSFLEQQEQLRGSDRSQRQASVIARIDQLESALRQRVDQSDNTTAAHVGQLEDRIERRDLPPLGEVIPERG